MDKLHEMIDFIESETMRDYLTEEVNKKGFTLSDEEMCSIVWNSEQALSMKQAFLMEFHDLPCAIDMIKRFEAIRLYLQEKHENEVYVLIINDKFYGVYNLYNIAKEEFEDFSEYVDDESDISLEMYDIRGSKFRGRLKLDETFEVTSFDFSYDVIEKYKLWNNADTDRVINKYIRLPHPFEEGDIVSTKGALETYRIVKCDLPVNLFNDLNFGDMAIEVVPYYEEEEDMSDLSDADAELMEDVHEMIPLLKLNLD